MVFDCINNRNCPFKLIYQLTLYLEMESYHHKSGAKKSQEKQQQIKGLRTLFDVGAFITEQRSKVYVPCSTLVHL